MKKIKTNKKMNTENSTLVTVEIPKIYTPKPQKMNRKYLSKNFFNFDISFIENETIENELDMKKNSSTLDSYSFEEIEKDFRLIKERREELKKKKQKNTFLKGSTRPNSVESENYEEEILERKIKRPINPFYKNFE